MISVRGLAIWLPLLFSCCTISQVFPFVIFILFLWFFVDNVHERGFKSFFVLAQSVLLPCVVVKFGIKVMSSHASLEETYACSVIGLLLKFERSTVFHELSKFRGVTATQLFERKFNLFLLDRGVFFILAPSW